MTDVDPITRLNAALEGRYHIERELGEGGMATVYLADDLRHERKVALKVLKPELAAVVGADRFLAEIKTTANLQHPHILGLHDSGEADGLLFYVMPYVEGESLRDRLDREHQLPVDDAVRIATNLAEALDYAHRKGVIHRDIKPANILLQDGKPVIADFGIALAVSEAGGGRLTETGLSLGTPYYMSPEQATGDLKVGPQADIYALGCVLYEMLIGEPPFTGSTPQAVLGRIITGEVPPPKEERASIPTNVDAAIRKALEKVPADRFVGARDFAKALGDAGFRHGERAIPEAPATAGPWKGLATAAIVVAAISTLFASWLFLSGGDAPASPVVRFTLPLGESADLHLGDARGSLFGRPVVTSFAVSPDGEMLVYAAWEETGDRGPLLGRFGSVRPESRLYRRRLDQARVEPITGTESGSFPFFSPDGEWIGFFSPEGLKRVSVADGNVETIVAGATDYQAEATWGDDDRIVWATWSGDLYEVPASGGEPRLLAASDSVLPGFQHRQPEMLPGSRALLFAGLPLTRDLELAEVFALDLATGNQTSLLANAMHPRYVDTGHLLFTRRGTLMAVGFDPDRLEVRGEPVIVQENVMQAIGTTASRSETGSAQVAVSASGHMAYADGGPFPERRRQLLRVTLDGAVEPLGLDPGAYSHPRISPEGDRLAFSVIDGRGSNLFVHDLDRRVTQSLNAGGFSNGGAEWSPDGRFIAFSSDREDWVANIYRIPADGRGDPERLAPSDQAQSMMSWSSEGVIAYLQGGDIWVLPPNGEPEPFFTSAAGENHASFSPDGRWIAYRSDQSGRGEVYVRPYPGPGPARLISDDGGISPAWSPDGNRLYLLPSPQDESVLMAVDVRVDGDLSSSRATTVVDPWPYYRTDPSRAYDVLPDGSFVVLETDYATTGRAPYRADELHVVLNFFEELRDRVPN